MDRATYEAAVYGQIIETMMKGKPKPKLARNSSTTPYVTDEWSPPGCFWEFDYQWEQEDVEDAPLAYVTAVRLVAHNGTEYPVAVGSLDGRWLSDIESLISDEILDAQP